jgi:hypothetical protein
MTSDLPPLAGPGEIAGRRQLWSRAEDDWAVLPQRHEACHEDEVWQVACFSARSVKQDGLALGLEPCVSVPYLRSSSASVSRWLPGLRSGELALVAEAGGARRPYARHRRSVDVAPDIFVEPVAARLNSPKSCCSEAG